MTFDLHIGIDYSGRETSTSRTPALQVYAAFDTEDPRRILSPASTEKTYKNWNRKEISEWLIVQAKKNITFIAGIDHGFSFPLNYFERYKLKSWPEFLDDFCEHWPTDPRTRWPQLENQAFGLEAKSRSRRANRPERQVTLARRRPDAQPSGLPEHPSNPQ